jgi:hypothetical protein
MHCSLDPRTCKDIHGGYPSTDGEHNLYLKLPECNQPVKIYCADMNTANPKEYVTLPAGGTKNFAFHLNKKEGYRNERQWTRFEKVLIVA